MPLENNVTLTEVIEAHNEYTGGIIHRVYGYNHTAVVRQNLDAVYNGIITESPELEGLSAVGFTALLKDGDTIPVQGNRLFINGTEETTDYTFTGENSSEGTELVKVWYFENNNSLILERINIDIISLKEKAKSALITFSDDFLNYIDNLLINKNLSVRTFGVKNHINTLTGTFADKVCDEVESYQNNCTYFPLSNSLINKVNLKKVVFPNLEEIAANGGGSFLNNCENVEEMIMPSLVTIRDNTGSAAVIFYKVKRVSIPESVNYAGSRICNGNKAIILNCKNAETIKSDWCVSAPEELFAMCGDWGATINIATAASNWIKDDFIDLFANKLRDMTLTDETRELKIPTAIYDTLTDEEFAVAEDKGWTIGA